MSNNSVLTKVKKTVAPETWCCAVRFNQDENTCILNDTETPFTVLPNTKNYWCADPFLFEKDGQYYVFFEVLDHMKRKGLLGYRTISADGFGDIKVIYECEQHLSFPFIYEENGDIYIIPESAHTGELFRLKCISFPDVWEKDSVILTDRLVDTVMYRKEGVRYYISQKVDDTNTFERVDVFYEQDGTVRECNGNPQKTDSANSRGAGKLFEYGGKLLRPAQDCSAAYGDKLNFNEVLRLDQNGFEEKQIHSVTCQDIPLRQKNEFNGIHTYNKLGNVEIIDLKIPAKFNIRNTVGAVNKEIRRLFH